MKKYVVAALCLASSAALTGCDAVKNMTGQGNETPPPAAIVDPADVARGTFSAEHVIVPSEDLGKRLNVPDGITATVTPNGTMTVTAAPGVPANAFGKTSGASIAVTPEQEAEFSNSRLTVKILARSGNGGTVQAQAAYSTFDVGTSNWKKFEVGSDYSVFSFTYDVKPIDKGQGDYVGILPVNGPIEVAAVGFDSEPLPAPVEATEVPAAADTAPETTE